MSLRSFWSAAARLVPLLLLVCALALPLAAARAQAPAPAAPAATAAPAPAAAAAAPAAAPAPPPACDAKTLEKCTPNSGDTAWMLTSMALVLMMTIPGLGLFYGGMVRKKNVGDTVMTSFAITCLVTVLVCVVTYSWRSRTGTPFIGGLEPRLPAGHPERHHQAASAIPTRSRRRFPRRLHVLPDDLRDHHARADRRRLRRAHEVFGDAVVHGAVGDLRLCAGRALGVGTGRLAQQQQRRCHSSRCSTSPAARSCTSMPASPG